MNWSPSRAYQRTWSKNCANSSLSVLDVGVALAAGALLGVRAATGSVTVWVVLAATLTVGIVPLLPRATWTTLVCFAVGCLVGVVFAVWRSPPDQTPLPAELPRTIAATVVSDPVVTAPGALGELRWMAPDGSPHTTS